MPNWVYNYLTIHPSDKHLVWNDKTQSVDFNIIAPMPDEMRDFNPPYGIQEACIYYLSGKLHLKAQAVTDILNKEYYGLLFSETPDGICVLDCTLRNPEFEKYFKATKEQVANYMKRLKELKDGGHLDGIRDDEMYDNGHKGCEFYKKYKSTHWYSWSVRNWGCKWNAGDNRIESETADECIIYFETPWGPPEEWIKALTRYKINFSLEWEEEQGYYGEYSYDAATDDFTDTGWLNPDPDDEDEDDNE